MSCSVVYACDIIHSCKHAGFNSQRNVKFCFVNSCDIYDIYKSTDGCTEQFMRNIQWFSRAVRPIAHATKK